MTDQTKNSRDTLEHRIFRSDSKLSPNEINQLLGVRVNVPTDGGYQQQVRAENSLATVFRLAIITIVLAALTLLGSMYQMQIGPFYDQEAFASGNG